MPSGPAQPHEPAKIQRYVLEGFDGGLRSEDTLSRVLVSDTECVCALNIEFWPPGTISKRHGRTYKNELEPLSGSITCIYQWWSEAGANHLLCFQAASGVSACSAQILTMTEATETSATWSYVLSSGQVASTAASSTWNPTEDDPVIVESFGGSALFVNGVDKMYVWSGTGYAAPVETAPVGVVCMRGYKNYLFVGNAEIPSGGERFNSRIWWSDPGDAHTWPESNYIDLDAKDGDLITGMEILGNELIVFKERKIYAVTYVGGVYEFYAENRMNGVGCASRASIIPIFSELCFYGIENFYSFTGRDVEALGDKIKALIINQILPEQRSKICGTSYEDKNQLWWGVPMDNDPASPLSAHNSHILVLDYELNAWTIFEGNANSLAWFSQATDRTFGDLTNAYFTYDVSWGERVFNSNSAKLVSGMYNGYMVDNGTLGSTSDLSADYEGFWRSRWLDFGMPETNKHIIRMTIFIDKDVNDEMDDYDVYVNVYKDWDADTVVDTFNLSVYGLNPVLERRLDFTTACRALQFELGTSKQGQSFTIHRIVIEYVPKGRTLVV